MGLEFRVNILHRNDEKLVSINLHLYKWIIRTSRKSADIRNSSKQPINASTRVSDIKPELRTERRSKKRESRNIRVGVRLIYRSTILVYVLPETANTSLAFSSRIIEKLLPGSGNCGRKTFRRRDPGPPPRFLLSEDYSTPLSCFMGLLFHGFHPFILSRCQII